MKRVSQWTGRAPHTRSVVSVCKSPVNKLVSVPFTSYIVAPGMWPAGWAVTSRSPMSTLSPKSIVRYLRRAVRRSPSSNGASKPSASAIFRESAKRRSATSAVGGGRTPAHAWPRGGPRKKPPGGGGGGGVDDPPPRGGGERG